jgi:hypothetical protein
VTDERYEGVNPPHPDRVFADQALGPSALRKRLQPDGTVTLTREEAVRIAGALLFYLRGWQEDPADDERAAPTSQLVDDAGAAAAEVLDADILPVEVLGEAMDLWDERWSGKA